MELQMAKLSLLSHGTPLRLCLLGPYRKYLLSRPLEFHPVPPPLCARWLRSSQTHARHVFRIRDPDRTALGAGSG